MTEPVRSLVIINDYGLGLSQRIVVTEDSKKSSIAW